MARSCKTEEREIAQDGLDDQEKAIECHHADQVPWL